VKQTKGKRKKLDMQKFVQKGHPKAPKAMKKLR